MKKGNFIVALFVVLFIVGAMVISYSEFSVIQQNGIVYMERSESYNVIESPVNETVEFVLDWEHPESSVGTEIYHNNACTITIRSIQDDLNGGYKIYLDAQGVYNYKGGRLITPLAHTSGLSDGFLQTMVGSNTYVSKTIYARGQSIYPNGDCIGYSIFPLECYERGKMLVSDQIKANGNQVEVKVIGLREIVWERV